MSLEGGKAWNDCTYSLTALPRSGCCVVLFTCRWLFMMSKVYCIFVFKKQNRTCGFFLGGLLAFNDKCSVPVTVIITSITFQIRTANTYKQWNIFCTLSWCWVWYVKEAMCFSLTILFTYCFHYCLDLFFFLGCKTKMFPSLKHLAINDNKISQVGSLVRASHFVTACIFI